MNKRKIFVLIALTFILSPGNSYAACKNPFLFFDLGQTIVDTDTNQYNPMFYFQVDKANFKDATLFPSGKNYVDALTKEGINLGLITDIPGDWGVHYPIENPVKDLPTAKVLRTMAFIEGIHQEDGASWKGEKMDWAPFVTIHGSEADRLAVGRLFLPQNDSERKGKGSLVLFQRALAVANAAGCKAIFQGENEKEMEMAERAGMVPFWVGHTMPGVFYLPVNQLQSYVKNYKPGDWKTGNP